MRYIVRVKNAVLLGMLATALLVAGCGPGPDWTALYTEKLGQPLAELDESTLNADGMDPVENGSLTRAAWAQFPDSSMVLLGLPAHSLKPKEVVERTVVVHHDQWQSACAAALGQDEVWSWRLPHAHRVNSIRIYLNNAHDRYCEFFFLPEGWELRTVESHGVLKSFHQP